MKIIPIDLFLVILENTNLSTCVNSLILSKELRKELKDHPRSKQIFDVFLRHNICYGLGFSDIMFYKKKYANRHINTSFKYGSRYVIIHHEKLSGDNLYTRMRRIICVRDWRIYVEQEIISYLNIKDVKGVKHLKNWDDINAFLKK